MASIEPYKKNGVASWRVKWREGGRHGRAMTVTFSDGVQATKFKELVNEAGNRMPSERVLDAYGLAWVLGDEPTSARPPVARQVTVSELCSLYLQSLAASPKPPGERTLKDYHQYVRDHVDTHWFGKVDVDEAEQDQARDWQAQIAAKPGFSAQSANKVRTGVVAPAFRWASISTKKDQQPIRTCQARSQGWISLKK